MPRPYGHRNHSLRDPQSARRKIRLRRCVNCLRPPGILAMPRLKTRMRRDKPGLDDSHQLVSAVASCLILWRIMSM